MAGRACLNIIDSKGGMKMYVKSKIYFVVVVIILLSGSLYAAEPKIETVIVSGIGISEQSAIKNASKTAIQQVVGMYVVSETVLKNEELIKDEVLSQSNAYIKSFTVTNKSKDDDGLYNVNAKVEVEVGKLTNRLGDLNIATKHVGTDEFFAITTSKFDASKDFRSMVDRIVFQPLRDNKNVYDIKVIKFQLLNKYDKYDFRWERNDDSAAAMGEIKPFGISFNICLSNAYINSVSSFFEKASKKSYDFYKKGTNNIYLTTELDGHGRVVNAIKTFEISQQNYKIFQSLYSNFIKNNLPRISFSFFGANESLVYNTFYSFNKSGDRNGNLKIGQSKYFYHVKSNTWDKLIKETFRSITGLFDMRLLRNVSGLHKNEIDMGSILFLNKDDISNIKNLKIEIMWLGNGV